MKPSWSAVFGSDPVVVDGGLSTQLERGGQAVGGRLWTGRVLLDQPQAITRAHREFVEAGADVVITASYQLSRQGFAAEGLDPEQADAALSASVAAARRAVAGGPARVAASVGPYGAILHDGSEYRGDYGLTRRELSTFHRERVDVLVDAGPDLLAIETIPDATEAQALVDVIGEHQSVPAWMTFTARNDRELWAGEGIEEAVRIAAHAPNVIAVGINCTDPRLVSSLIARAAQAADLPIVVYPNAGGSWDARAGDWAGDRSCFADEQVELWRAAGAVAIGGCCGTDSATVRRIAAVLARTGS